MPQVNPWAFTETTASRFLRRASAASEVTARLHVHRPAGVPAAAAWVNRRTGLAEFITSMLDHDPRDRPERIDLMRPVDRARNPILAGAICHEAAHFAHTRWPDRARDVAGDSEALAAAILLEEARCEQQLLTSRPADRMLLRAATAHVVLGGVDPAAQDRDVIGTILALVLPRVASGVFPADSVEPLLHSAGQAVGGAGLARFEALAREALCCKDNDTTNMLRIGRDWVAAIREYLPSPEASDERQGDGQEQADGGGGSSSLPNVNCGCAGADGQDPSVADCSPEPDSGTSDTGPGDHETGAEDNATTAAARQILADIRDAAAAAINPDTRRPPAALPSSADPTAAEHTTIANQVFGGTGSRPTDITYRTPDTAALTARAVMIHRIRQARIRRATRQQERITYPAGRLSATRLMDRAAQVATRQPVTALPWTRRRIRTADQPPWQCGIVLDTSGSMSDWWPAAGTALWALSNAVTQLGGAAAAAAFSGDVTPLLYPGQILPGVPVIHGGGGSDNAGAALQALAGAGISAVNGKLHMTGSYGARVQVVITDSQLPDHDDVQRAVDYLTSRGVAVVWAVTVAQPAWTPRGATVVADVAPEHVATTLIDACVAALT